MTVSAARQHQQATSERYGLERLALGLEHLRR